MADRQPIKRSNVQHIISRLAEALDAATIECGGNLSEQVEALLTAAERGAWHVIDTTPDPNIREQNRMIIAAKIVDKLLNPIIERHEVTH